MLDLRKKIEKEVIIEFFHKISRLLYSELKDIPKEFVPLIIADPRIFIRDSKDLEDESRLFRLTTLPIEKIKSILQQSAKDGSSDAILKQIEYTLSKGDLPCLVLLELNDLGRFFVVPLRKVFLSVPEGPTPQA